jgi:hypothetical protein
VPEIAGVELLESRVLYAGDGVPPTLQEVRLVGTPGKATGITLTFSEPLDAASATDVSAYSVRGGWRTWLTRKSRRELRISSATHDGASRTVTLFPEKSPFDPGRFVRVLRVRADVVRDESGTRLDGDADGGEGGDAVWQFRHLTHRRTIAYPDATRSRVILRLSGPGRLRLVQRVVGTETRLAHNNASYRAEYWGEGLQLWVDGATAESVLTGSVSVDPRRGPGDATTTLMEIINPGGARLDLLANPAFQVTQ